MNKKICKIVNDKFCWVMYVDEQEINFNGGYNAIYFAKHYKKLGYKIIKKDWNETPTKRQS